MGNAHSSSMSGSSAVRTGRRHLRNISSTFSASFKKELYSGADDGAEPPPLTQIRGNQKVGRLLASVPVLARLDRKQRNQLGGALTRRLFKKDDIIMNEGDEADGFYIIKRGEVKVVIKDSDGKNVEVGRLKAGDYFGERALLTPGAKRNATVQAVSETKCFYLDKSHFLEFFKGHNKVMFAKREAVIDGDYLATTMPVSSTKEKNEDFINKLCSAVSNNPLFRSLDERHKIDIVKEMYTLSVKAGTTLINQGERGDTFYVISDKGEVKVQVDGEDITSTGPWTCFGELALLYNAPRAATCIAVADTDLWVVDRHTFRRIAKDISQARLDKYIKLLEKIDDLAPLASFEREKVAGALAKRVYDEGKKIYEAGDQADAMYIVQSGEVELLNGQSKKQLRVVKAGGYFGASALMQGTPRSNIAVATKDCKLLRLDRNDFHLLLGPLEDIMKRPSMPTIPVLPPRESIDRDKLIARMEEKKKEGPKREEIDVKNLEVLTLLGKGAFGRVKLVRDKTTAKTYALKVVNKALVVRARQEIHIMGEKNVMCQINHPFIVHLHKTFMDKDTLYFLMEVCLGGDFFGYLRERFNFSENEGRFYAGCVVLLLEYLHSKDIIYRDLKPENLLIDPRGYLKMIDFGFATIIGNGRTHTLCGTPDYMAPEIVMSKGHGKGVDCWTLGVLIFEMQAGYPPFYDQDPMKQYQKIRQGSVECPSHFSPSLRDLVLGLLQLEPHKRLGNGLNGWERARAHPWFKGFSWEKLLRQKYKAPYTPKLKSSTDVSNFHKYPTPAEEIVPFKETADRWEKDFGPVLDTAHLQPGKEVPI